MIILIESIVLCLAFTLMVYMMPLCWISFGSAMINILCSKVRRYGG